jgi:hypothetical protein
MSDICEEEEIANTGLGNKSVRDTFFKVNDGAEFLMEFRGKNIILDRGMCKGD